MRITVIGVGNIGSAIVKGLINGNITDPKDIICTDLMQDNLKKINDFCSEICTNMPNNIEATKDSDIIIIAVKPWRVEQTINEIKEYLDYNKQIVVSIAAGIDFTELSSFFKRVKKEGNRTSPTLYRVMPNIAIEVQSSMTMLSAYQSTNEQDKSIVSIFNSMGSAMLIDEQLMTAGTALASSGIAFALRYIRAASEGGVELGFYPDQAKEIVINTVKGAVNLLLSNGTNPESEIDRVTTPGGLTIRGLNKMEEEGFTPSIIKGLKATK